MTASPIIGTLPQWGLFIAVLTWMARIYLGKGRLAIDAKQVELKADGELRGHFSQEVQSLRDQVISMGKHHLEREREIDDRWRKLLHESEERHSECVRQREELAKEVEDVKQRQLGTIRQFLTFQRELIKYLPESMRTPETMRALESLAPGENIEWKMP